MKPLKTLIFVFFVFTFTTNYSQDIVDHSPWDQILILNVTQNGLVDYEGVTTDVIVFYKYFR